LREVESGLYGASIPVTAAFLAALRHELDARGADGQGAPGSGSTGLLGLLGARAAGKRGFTAMGSSGDSGGGVAGGVRFPPPTPLSLFFPAALLRVAHRARTCTLHICLRVPLLLLVSSFLLARVPR
jgi:hypothetical protein